VLDKSRLSSLLSDSKLQSLVWTIVYSLLYIFSEAIPQDTILAGILVFGTAIPFPVAAAICYLFCFIFTNLGKKVIRNQHLGGHLGGMLGVIVSVILFCGLILLLLGRSP